jgi:hypothetical protein
VRLVNGVTVVNDIRSSGCLHSRRFTNTAIAAPQQRCMRRLTYCSRVDSEEDLIARIAEAAATSRQGKVVFELTGQSLLHRRRNFIEVGGLRFNICSKLVTNTVFSEFFSGFSLFPTLVRPTLIVSGTAKTHVRRVFA